MFLAIFKFKQILLQTMVSRRVKLLQIRWVVIVKKFKCKVKEQIWGKKNKRLDECSTWKKKVKVSLELLMRREEGAIVEDSFDKIQKQEQDANEEEVSSI